MYMYCIQHTCTCTVYNIHVHVHTCTCIHVNYHLEVWKVSKYKNYKTLSEDDRKEVHRVHACIGTVHVLQIQIQCTNVGYQVDRSGTCT